MKRYGVLLLLLLMSAVRAGEMHRCVSPDRDVSYQSAACPEGYRTDRTIVFTTDPGPASVARAQHPAPSLRTRGRSATRWNAVKAPRVDPCAKAKGKREQALSRLGLKRTYDQLSRIDAAVRKVCNGY